MHGSSSNNDPFANFNSDPFASNKKENDDFADFFSTGDSKPK